MKPNVARAAPVPPSALQGMEAQAAEAAAMLRLLANESRLLLLCILIAEGEASVGVLAERVGLSQPALSQHLAKLREDGLVSTRRTGTTIPLPIADPRVARITPRCMSCLRQRP